MATERQPHWTVHFDSERIRVEGSTVNRWWSGQGHLFDDAGASFDPPQFEGHVWRGATYRTGGSVLRVGAVQFTQSYPGRRATIQLAVTRESLRRLLTVDLGAIEVELGWVYRARLEAGAADTLDADRDPATRLYTPWTRIPRYLRGRLGKSSVVNGEGAVEIETYLGDIDRGIPEYWSHETADEGDLYAEQAAELASGVEFRWPPFERPEGRAGGRF